MEQALTTRMIVGIILWWGEGTKSRRDKRWKTARSYPIEFTNTNPAIIQIFMDFLRGDLNAPEELIRVQLQIHEGDNADALESYWSSLTGVPIDRFNKTIIRPVGNKIGKSKGTCKIRFSNKSIYLQMEKLLSLVQSELYDEPEKILKTMPHYELVG